MPWLRPSGHTDTAGSWVNEEAAYDGDPATYAECETHFAGHWTGPLTFIFTPCKAETFHCVITIPGLPVEVRFWGRRDGEATWWDPSPLDIGTHEIDLELGEGIWDRVGIRLRSPLADWGGGQVNDVRLLCPCIGPLAPICVYFYSISAFLAGLADDIEDIWLVGGALSSPFRLLAETIQDLGDDCCEASGLLQDILNVLEGGITWEEISALILKHWPGLAPLVDDPTAYISEIVTGLLPTLPDWLDDPLGWLTDTLEEHFPLLYYLVVDPAGQLLYLISVAFDLEPYQAQSAEFILKALFERWFPELYLLWRELAILAGIYEREGAAGVMRELKDRFYHLAERALRYVWEGIWQE